MVPRYSVVIPAFNAERWIKEALESVRGQSETGWEAIVVEDGSTDATGRIVDGLAGEDSRIRVVRHPGGLNRGRGASRNLGVAAARGEIVVFLDADDELAPGALAIYGRSFAEHPESGVVYGRASVIGEVPEVRVIGRGAPGVAVRMFRQLVRFNVVITSATAVRRRALGEKPFPEDMALAQDWACWVKLAREWPFLFVQDILAHYRVNPEGATETMLRTGKEAERFAAQVRFLQEFDISLSAEERDALRNGLAFRMAVALRRGISSFRRGDWSSARLWWKASCACMVEPGMAFRAVLDAVNQQRAIRRNEDPPLEMIPVSEGDAEENGVACGTGV